MGDVVEWGWMITSVEPDALCRVVERWAAERLPHRIEIDEHGGITAEDVKDWMEARPIGGVLAALLEGDDGPLTVCFERQQDAVLFKLMML